MMRSVVLAITAVVLFWVGMTVPSYAEAKPAALPQPAAQARAENRPQPKPDPAKAAEDQYNLAKTCADAGRDREAVTAYRKAISLATSDSLKYESYRGIIAVQMRLGDYREAARSIMGAEISISSKSMASQVIFPNDMTLAQQAPLADALESVLGTRKGFVLSRLQLAHLRLRLGDAEKGRRLIASVRSQIGSDPVLLRCVYEVCVLNEKAYGDGVSIAEQRVAIDPNDRSYACSLVSAYRYAGMDKQAIEQADKVLLKWPNNEECASHVAFDYAALKAWDKAIAAYKLVKKLNPKSGDDFRLAEAYENAGKLAEAEDIYEKLAAEAGDGNSKSFYLNKLARCAASAGSMNEAAALMVKGEEAGNPTSIQSVLRELFLSPRRLKDSAGLASALEAALNGKDKFVLCRMALAGLYFDNNRSDDATALIKPILDRVDDVMTLEYVSFTAINRKCLQLGIDLEKRAVAVDPKNYHLQMSLGLDYASAGMMSEAAACARKMIQENPNDLWAPYYAGWILETAQQPDEAVQVFEQALKAGQASSEITRDTLDQLCWSCASHIAGIYKTKGDNAKAAEWWQYVIDNVTNEGNRQLAAKKLKELSPAPVAPKP